MKEFSFYKDGITQTTPNKNLDILTCAKIIRNSAQLLTKTQVLRTIPRGGEKKYGFKRNQTKNDACKSGLPYCTFSGTFSKRASDKLIERSEYFCLDLDHVGENGQIKEKGRQICSFYTPALMFVSPNSDGLKAIFRIDPTAGSHLEFFTAFKNFFATKINLPIDEACKDISRATFLCHDPEVFLSDNPDVIGKEFLLQPEILPVVEGLTYEGAKKWTLEKESFVNGNRNQFVVALADTCNRYQIDKNEALTKIIADFAIGDFTAEEITTTVENRYNHQEWHGIALTSSSPNPFIRVGTTYYKVIEKKDRYGLNRKELKVWNKDTILQDYKKTFLKGVPHYDDFVMVPDNINFKPFVNNCYNLYSEFRHVPAPGEWTWTKYLLEHVFGEQIELGIRLMQILYLYPDKQTVILVLVSAMKQTGKTTFLNWLNMLVGDNMALLSSSDFLSSFNYYGRKNIIAIEETLFEKRLTMEKLKALATQKYITINEKFVAQYMIPFYGKIILTSNYEDKFALVDPDEIRFFVRKLGEPLHINHAIESELLKEIPAFLNYLQSLPALDWKNPPSRSGFSADELMNENLTAVKRESRPGLYKDIELHIADFFYNNKQTFFLATVQDIKNKFFRDDTRNQINYIRTILKDEFRMQPEKLKKYYPFEEETAAAKTGRPYRFNRIDFVTEDEDLVTKDTPPF
jgi:hypothetical protein